MKDKNFETIEIPIDKIKEFLDIPEEELKLINSVSIKAENLNKVDNINLENTVTIPVYDIKSELKKFSFDKDDEVTIPISKLDSENLQKTITIPIKEIENELEKAEYECSDTITICIDDIKNKLNEYKRILNANENEDSLENRNILYDNQEPIIIDNNDKIEQLASNDSDIEKTINIPLEKIKTNFEKIEYQTVTIPVDEIKLNLKEENRQNITDTIEIPKDLIIESVKNDIQKEKKKYFKINNKLICKKIWLVLFIISIVAIISLVYNIISWQKQDSSDNEINNLQKTTVSDKNTNNPVVKQDSNSNNSNFININLNESIEINEDTIGWIKINNTDINHPFVKTNDNEYYQSHSFYKTNSSGWMYLDKDNDIDLNDRNNILYTELYKNSTQFASLKNMVEPEWYQNKDNRIIKISGLNNNSLWEIFSIYTTDKNDYSKNKFELENDFSEYYNAALINSYENFNVSINQNDKLLTIVSYFDKDLKLVIHSKLIGIEKKEFN